MTLKGAAAVWVDSVSGMESAFLCGTWARRAGAVLQVKGLLVLARLTVLSAMLFLLYRRRIRGFSFQLCVFVLILHAGTFLSVTMVRGAPHAYLMVWFSAAGLLSWTAAALSLRRLLISTERAGKIRCARWVVSSVLVVFSVSNTLSVSTRRGEGIFDPLSLHNRELKILCESLVCEIDSSGTGSWRVSPVEHHDWPLMAGLVNCLQKRGMEARVTEEFVFMTGVAPGPGFRTLHITSGDLPEGTEEPLAVSGSLRVFAAD